MKSIDSADTFGGQLRLLRRAARLTQSELGAAVGYSPGQISMLENNQRTPDPSVVAALFIAALGLKDTEPAAVQLLQIARQTQATPSPSPTPKPHQQMVRVVERHVIWERQEIGVLEDIPTLPQQLAHRADALAHLHDTLSNQHALALLGLPGMGKTTLAASYARQYAKSHPVLWITVSPGINHRLDDVLHQLTLFVIAYGRDAAATFASAVVNSQPHSDNAPTQLPSAQRLDGICANLGEMNAPLIVLDDAHHFQQDTAILSALQRIRTLTPNAALLCTTRERLEVSQWPEQAVYGLSPDEATVWLAQLNPRQYDPHQTHTLIQQTEGNPLLLRLSLELGQASTAHAHTRAHAHAQPMIASVMQALSPSGKQLLEFLAIQPREINLADHHLAQYLETHLAAYNHVNAVRDLQRHALITQSTQAILHALLREPASNDLRLRPNDWAHCQRTAAQWAKQHGDVIAAVRHWASAGDWQRACETISRDMDVAKLVRTNRAVEAAAVIDDLITLINKTAQPDPPRQWIKPLHIARGELLLNTSQAEEARASLTEALMLEGKPIAKARIAERLAHHLQNTGAFADALSLCEQAEQLLGRSKLPEAIKLRLELSSPRIKALIGLSRFAEADAVSQQLLSTANKLTLILPKTAEEIRAQASLALGYTARIAWRSDDAVRHLSAAAQHAQRADMSDVQANALILHSATERDLGRFSQAEALAEQALNIAEASGNAIMVATVLHWLSVLNYFRDEHDDALQHSERSAELRHKLGDREGVLACRLLQAVSLLALNRWDALNTLLEQVASLMPSMQNPWLLGYAEYVSGIAVLCAIHKPNHLGQAQAHYERALAIEAFRNDPDLGASTQIFLALAHAAQDNHALADECLERATLPPNHAQPILLKELTHAMIALMRGEVAAAIQIAQDLVKRARDSGYFVYATEAGRVLKFAEQPHPVQPTNLARWVICGDWATDEA